MSEAPSMVLQDTLGVASVRLATQSVIFFFLPKNAIIFLLSTIRNCLLTPLLPFMTNFCPLLHPSEAILSISHRSIYSQCEPLITFLPDGARFFPLISAFISFSIFLLDLPFFFDFFLFPAFDFLFPPMLPDFFVVLFLFF